MKHDMPNEWNLLMSNKPVNITIEKSRLPYMAQITSLSIEQVLFIAKLKTETGTFSPTIKEGTTPIITSSFSLPTEMKLLKGLSAPLELLHTYTLQINLTDIEEVIMVVKYSF